MKKLILLPLLVFIHMAYGQQPLRHFMQGEKAYPGVIPYGNNSAAGNYVKTKDGAIIYYEVYGKGQPFVVLHGGIFGSQFELNELLDSLSRRYQVIAISTRGHGRSSLGSEPMSYYQRAEDAMTVINKVTRERVLVFGFSDGGYTAYHLAVTHPERVKKMIVMGASEIKPGDRQINITVADAMKLDSLYIQQQLRLMPEPGRLQEMFTGIAQYVSNQLVVDRELLKKVQCPVLIMAGDRDQGVPLQKLVNTAGMINNCQLAVLPNCGHTAFLDNFPACWAGILPFLW